MQENLTFILKYFNQKVSSFSSIRYLFKAVWALIDGELVIFIVTVLIVKSQEEKKKGYQASYILSSTFAFNIFSNHKTRLKKIPSTFIAVNKWK